MARFLVMSAGALPSKTSGSGASVAAGLFGRAADRVEVSVLPVIGEPRDLERAVVFHEAAGVVVDRFAGAGEQAGGGVVVAEDQLRIGFGELQGDADRHLAERAAGQAARAADGLRAQQHVHAESTALTDEAVDEQRRILARACRLRRRIPGIRRRSAASAASSPRRGSAVGVEILDAGLAVEITAASQFGVEALQHAEAKLAIALDRDDPRVRQVVRRRRS